MNQINRLEQKKMDNSKEIKDLENDKSKLEQEIETIQQEK